MDRTHISWSTRLEISQAFENAGSQVLSANVNYNSYSLLKRILIYPLKCLIKDFDVCKIILLANRKINVSLVPIVVNEARICINFNFLQIDKTNTL